MSNTSAHQTELSRLTSLIDLDLDYLDLEHEFKYLTKLVSQITGMDVSLLNLLDTNILWPVSHYGLDVPPGSVKDSVCQYTLAEGEYLKISDLSADHRFKDKAYVKGYPFFRYYFGVPLKAADGTSIGTLCVFNGKQKELTPHQIELLKTIAEEVAEKFRLYKSISTLKRELAQAKNRQKQIARQLRDPLAGIVGLSDVLVDEDAQLTPTDTAGYISLINSSSKEILKSANDIINLETPEEEVTFTLASLSDKLLQYYEPIAAFKSIALSVQTKSKKQLEFLRNNLMQIVGNLISDAIELSGAETKVSVLLDIKSQPETDLLVANVEHQANTATETAIFTVTKKLVELLGGELSANVSGGKKQTELTLPLVIV